DAPEDAWKRLRRLAGEMPTDATPAVVLRIGVPSSEVGAMVAAATDAGCTAWGHVAAGSVTAHARPMPAASVAALRTRAERAGGFLQVDAAPVALRIAMDPF